jgi:hypothetical protein
MLPWTFSEKSGESTLSLITPEEDSYAPPEAVS